jgi:CBS domain-containing membrane protein
MAKNILTLEYGTEVEDAWKIMHTKKLKAMPVVDRNRRVIGIITWNDFFKYVDADGNETFLKKFRAFKPHLL